MPTTTTTSTTTTTTISTTTTTILAFFALLSMIFAGFVENSVENPWITQLFVEKQVEKYVENFFCFPIQKRTAPQRGRPRMGTIFGWGRYVTSYLTLMVISSSPGLTLSPSLTSTSSTIPAMRATMEVSIFMASMTART